MNPKNSTKISPVMRAEIKVESVFLKKYLYIHEKNIRSIKLKVSMIKIFFPR